MQVTFNPKDINTFANASLDRTIKIWNLGSPDLNFTLDAHQKGVNCVYYFTGGDKPYLITESDDHTAKLRSDVGRPQTMFMQFVSILKFQLFLLVPRTGQFVSGKLPHIGSPE